MQCGRSQDAKQSRSRFKLSVLSCRVRKQSTSEASSITLVRIRLSLCVVNVRDCVPIALVQHLHSVNSPILSSQQSQILRSKLKLPVVIESGAYREKAERMELHYR